MRRLLLIALVACAPTVDGPAERQRAIDRDDAGALAAQLEALPGAVRAHVVLHRAVADPLASRTTPASAAILLIVDDRADVAAVTADARRLTRAAAPDIDAASTALVVDVGAKRPELAKVGPFEVDTGSRRALAIALVGGLAMIAILAGWIMWRERHRFR